MLRFRPHHFLCTLGFEGKGYSDEFVASYAEIASSLRAPGGEDTPIEVAGHTDSICAPCPHRRGSLCATEGKIRSLDQAHASILGLEAGETLTWREAQRRIAERMTDEEFERACAPCAWKPLGVCKSALQKLRAAAVLLAAALIAAVTAAPALSHAALVRENEDSSRLRPVDLVRADLVRKHKSRPARVLKKAWEALQAKNYSKAAHLAAPLSADALFGDYGNWVVATANFAAAQKALASKRYADAIRNAEATIAATFRIEARSPYSPMLRNLNRDVGLAEVAEGDAYSAQKKWKFAQKVYERGLQRLAMGNSLGLLRPGSLRSFAQACATAKGSDSELCDAWVLRFSFMYPRNSEEMRALTQVIPGAADHPRPAFGGKLVQSYKAPDLDQTAFEQDMALYLDGKFGEAIKGFQQFIDEYPKSPFRWRGRYWLAQAMTHEQQHDKAQQAYENLQHDSPLTYYGLLAAFAAGHNMDAPIQSQIPLVTERDPLLQASELLRVERAEQLIAEGAFDLAEMELKEFKIRDSLSSPFLMYLAELATQGHSYLTAFNLLGDLVARGYDGATTAEFLSLVFPLAHLDEIKKQAAANELDPVLVLSLIKQESAFDATAISGSGALGLMQLMPATASDTDPSVDRADLVEPETNVRVGTKYLKHLLTRFNGNIVLALAGYNAGPNAADRWFRDQGDKRGMVDFIETIPYKETREYVCSIIRNYYWYSRKLTPEAPAKAMSYFWNMYGPPEAASPVPALSPAIGTSPLPALVSPPPAQELPPNEE